MLATCVNILIFFLLSVCRLQNVTVEDAYLCGYLKIKGLTEVQCETRLHGGPKFHAYRRKAAYGLTFALKV